MITRKDLAEAIEERWLGFPGDVELNIGADGHWTVFYDFADVNVLKCGASIQELVDWLEELPSTRGIEECDCIDERGVADRSCPDCQGFGVYVVAACYVCGCTSRHACEGGCAWVDPDSLRQLDFGREVCLCTRCAVAYRERLAKEVRDAAAE